MDFGRSIKDMNSQSLETKLQEVALRVSRLEEKIDEVLTLLRRGGVITKTAKNDQTGSNNFGNGGDVSVNDSPANKLEIGFETDEEAGERVVLQQNTQHLGTVKSCLSEAGEDNASVVDK